MDIPNLDYGAVIPKGDYVTVCLLSSHGDLQPGTMDTFLNHPSVKSLLPANILLKYFACSCGPRINVKGSAQPFGDRMVFIGDCGVSRLYKDGIGGAYRTAKAAARTAIFQGVSSKDFKRYYLPFCRKIEADNRVGQLLFMIVGHLNKRQFVQRAVLHMVVSEQEGKANVESGMSMIMWDMLTGGAPYKEVLLRALQPVFLIRFLWNMMGSFFSRNKNVQAERSIFGSYPNDDAYNSQMMEADAMKSIALGKVYQNGEVIFRVGEAGDCMFVVQDGQVEIVGELDGHEVRLAVNGTGQVIGEMAIFERQARSATARALGKARVLTVDEKTFLRYIHEDPSFAYQLLKIMSGRVRNYAK
jgi:hypothetical protein